MSRWFSWTWCFEEQLDRTWTAQQVVLDWLSIQLGTFLEKQEPESRGNDEARAKQCSTTSSL